MAAATRCLLSWVDSRAAPQLAMIAVAGGLEQGEVEVQLAGEVLVEHRLGDPGAFGDVVHGGRVIALRDEHLEGGRQQLRAALAARQPAAAGADLVDAVLVGHAGEPTCA